MLRRINLIKREKVIRCASYGVRKKRSDNYNVATISIAIYSSCLQPSNGASTSPSSPITFHVSVSETAGENERSTADKEARPVDIVSILVQMLVHQFA